METTNSRLPWPETYAIEKQSVLEILVTDPTPPEHYSRRLRAVIVGSVTVLGLEEIRFQVTRTEPEVPVPRSTVLALWDSVHRWMGFNSSPEPVGDANESFVVTVRVVLSGKEFLVSTHAITAEKKTDPGLREAQSATDLAQWILHRLSTGVATKANV